MSTATKFRSALQARDTLANRLALIEINEHPVEVVTRAEFAETLRLRTTVTNATGDVVPPWTQDSVDSPGAGDRLAGLFRIREAPEPAVGVSEETGAPAAVVQPVDYGS